MRGVTRFQLVFELVVVISTRTPHAGSDFLYLPLGYVGRISTRTPHAGSDQRTPYIVKGSEISTRTPHAGSDISYPSKVAFPKKFQPALPMRGVTLRLPLFR